MIKGKIHPLALEIDRGYEIKAQMKSLEDEGITIKKKLREAAAKEPGVVLGSGESIVLQGNKHKAKVNLSEDSFSLKDEVSSTDIRRMKAVLDAGVATIEEGVSLKNGITLRKVKDVMGDQFGELFEDALETKIDAKKMTVWLNEKRKIASSEQSVDSVEFVERNLNRKPNTLRVTFSK